ncbi:hypothetical protein C8R45DRAFT_966710 [Mycena sanguinolenta]|nr:hypothetical protein C8R45DRAFT_966710 [Mycena sanguinolenta]
MSEPDLAWDGPSSFKCIQNGDPGANLLSEVSGLDLYHVVLLVRASKNPSQSPPFRIHIVQGPAIDRCRPPDNTRLHFAGCRQRKLVNNFPKPRRGARGDCNPQLQTRLRSWALDDTTPAHRRAIMRARLRFHSMETFSSFDRMPGGWSENVGQPSPQCRAGTKSYKPQQSRDLDNIAAHKQPVLTVAIVVLYPEGHHACLLELGQRRAPLHPRLATTIFHCDREVCLASHGHLNHAGRPTSPLLAGFSAWPPNCRSGTGRCLRALFLDTMTTRLLRCNIAFDGPSEQCLSERLEEV